MENVDDEGDDISITAWDTKEHADAYEASGIYKELVGKVAGWMTGPPELSTYEVKE